jgi:hypothetical protein
LSISTIFIICSFIPFLSFPRFHLFFIHSTSSFFHQPHNFHVVIFFIHFTFVPSKLSSFFHAFHFLPFRCFSSFFHSFHFSPITHFHLFICSNFIPLHKFFIFLSTLIFIQFHFFIHSNFHPLYHFILKIH